LDLRAFRALVAVTFPFSSLRLSGGGGGGGDL
jgi:hypothetical protein